MRNVPAKEDFRVGGYILRPLYPYIFFFFQPYIIFRIYVTHKDTDTSLNERETKSI